MKHDPFGRPFHRRLPGNHETSSRAAFLRTRASVSLLCGANAWAPLLDLGVFSRLPLSGPELAACIPERFMVVARLGGGLSKAWGGKKKGKRVSTVDETVVPYREGRHSVVANSFLAQFSRDCATLDLREDGEIGHIAQVVPLFLNFIGTDDLVKQQRPTYFTTKSGKEPTRPPTARRSAVVSAEDDTTEFTTLAGSRVVARSDLRERFHLLYQHFNRDGSEGLDAEDLQRAMDHIGRHVSMRGAEYMLAEIDTNGNGEVDFEEFYTVCESLMKAELHVENDVRDERRERRRSSFLPQRALQLQSMSQRSLASAVAKIEDLPGGDSFTQAASTFCKRVAESYMALAGLCGAIAESPKFEAVVIIHILFVGVATYARLSPVFTTLYLSTLTNNLHRPCYAVQLRSGGV